MEFKTETWQAAPEVKRRLDAIREGKVEDRFGWMYPVR
jgi:hypothetical protein